MRQLIEQLENNTSAIEHLEARYNGILQDKYGVYELFRTRGAKQRDAAWVLKVKERVILMRYALLEKIKVETIKEAKIVLDMIKTNELKAA